ncbi:hypothetical protein, partial [Streptomyces sp. WAC06614]|uniref:hypothetical protein n=1 Tax=Streptomyces sp. WAC06614 TaxID=2487416 RepID=UPI000F78CAD3
MDVVDVRVAAAVGIFAALLSAVVVVRSWAAKERAWDRLAASAGPVRPPEAGLSLYELAFLAYPDGPGAVLGVALVRMHAEQRLTLRSQGVGFHRFEVADPVPRDEVEAALLKRLAEEAGRLPTALGPHDRSGPPWDELHRRLVTDGLLGERGLPDGVPADAPEVLAWTAACVRVNRTRARVLAGLWAAGAATALLSGAWLLLAVHVAASPALSFLGRRPTRVQGLRTTEAGEAAVRAARAAPPASEEAQVLLRVAVGGMEAVPYGHPLWPTPGR